MVIPKFHKIHNVHMKKVKIDGVEKHMIGCDCKYVFQNKLPCIGVFAITKSFSKVMIHPRWMIDYTTCMYTTGYEKFTERVKNTIDFFDNNKGYVMIDRSS